LTDSKSPRKKSKLFRNLQFIVTGAKNKGEIRTIIDENGGYRIDHYLKGPNASLSPFKRTVRKGCPSMVLLADKERRTIKYVLGLVSGTPCVHYDWLLQCVEKEKILPYEPYLLPSGFSVTRNCIILRTNLRPYCQNFVFDNLRIELIGVFDWKAQWSMILREGGAKVVQRLYSDSEDRIDCIVCDKHPGDEIVQKTKKNGSLLGEYRMGCRKCGFARICRL